MVKRSERGPSASLSRIGTRTSLFAPSRPFNGLFDENSGRIGSSLFDVHRTAGENCRGSREIGRGWPNPERKWPKYPLFTRRTGPVNDLWKPFIHKYSLLNLGQTTQRTCLGDWWFITNYIFPIYMSYRRISHTHTCVCVGGGGKYVMRAEDKSILRLLGRVK